MRKTGFTLVELIAIITVLGIISLITVPTVNKVINDSKKKAFGVTVNELKKSVVTNCKLEKLDKIKITNLYTIVEGKLDKDLDLGGDLPDHGYILVKNNCEVAYSFYDEKYVASKNFDENKPLVTDNDNALAYGLEWRSNIATLDDTYTRTLDASSIGDGEVNVQIGNTPVTNAFDKFDIYKDILPYTDELGNKFMLIPKFYIKKTKEKIGNEIVWNYAVSKLKLDEDYYLPSNFVDEGVNNNEHIELPYVLVGKYEASSKQLPGSDKVLGSMSGKTPTVILSIDQMRTLINNNNKNGITGYQQYDIYVHDLLSVLFYIEFKTVNSQSIMKGHSNYGSLQEPTIMNTGGSDSVISSSGAPNDGISVFHYRGMENLWGNVWSYIDGITTQLLSKKVYYILNSRYYKLTPPNNYYKVINNFQFPSKAGYVSESFFNEDFPFYNETINTDGNYNNNNGDYYFVNTETNDYTILIAGGSWYNESNQIGLNTIYSNWGKQAGTISTGTRVVKTAMRN